ncbi:MAG: UDP-N-acetylglucosamine 1-carboxyvinyltransferase [Oscillospiraceae bacterium]|nr:UDP-N-acetylglucosamine 1-carboxyvinyltransferase [Oscillospiraceae bacterium]
MSESNNKDKLIILGGSPLIGEVEISGAKNSAVAIIPAAILVEGKCVIDNIPNISDVAGMLKILTTLGADVKHINSSTVEIDCSKMSQHSAPYDIVRKMRASSYLMGALLGRFNRSSVAMPGGCDFGVRPVDQHIKGFETLGATVNIEHGMIDIYADELVGTNIYMDVVSVGATINLILAAARAQGTTIIENAAKEPHVVDVANFLTAMGANIVGAGTDVIKVKGVPQLGGGTYSIIPDQIEAGTYMIMAAATAGDVLVKNVIPKHLESITAKLLEAGVTVEEFDDSIRVTSNGKFNKINVKTLPYPGFPTDLQPQILTLLTLAEGTSIVTEGVWDNRFRYVDELIRMGANVMVDGKVAVVEGVKRLSGSPVAATDLRAGAAMLIAALAAHGVTEIHDLTHIDRGYENFEQKLKALGAQITRRNGSRKKKRTG